MPLTPMSIGGSSGGLEPLASVGSIPARSAGCKDTGRLAVFYTVRRGSIPLQPTSGYDRMAKVAACKADAREFDSHYPFAAGMEPLGCSKPDHHSSTLCSGTYWYVA